MSLHLTTDDKIRRRELTLTRSIGPVAVGPTTILTVPAWYDAQFVEMQISSHMSSALGWHHFRIWDGFAIVYELYTTHTTGQAPSHVPMQFRASSRVRGGETFQLQINAVTGNPYMSIVAKFIDMRPLQRERVIPVCGVFSEGDPGHPDVYFGAQACCLIRLLHDEDSFLGGVPLLFRDKLLL